jgi:transcription initiation factor TFIIIB Brf1 subunit/transcription initiation factor TFIIB
MWNAMPYNERTLWNVFDKLTGISLSNGIPQKIIDDAKVLYKRASEKKISRGDNKEGLIDGRKDCKWAFQKKPEHPRKCKNMT